MRSLEGIGTKGGLTERWNSGVKYCKCVRMRVRAYRKIGTTEGVVLPLHTARVTLIYRYLPQATYRDMRLPILQVPSCRPRPSRSVSTASSHLSSSGTEKQGKLNEGLGKYFLLPRGHVDAASEPGRALAAGRCFDADTEVDRAPAQSTCDDDEPTSRSPLCTAYARTL